LFVKTFIRGNKDTKANDHQCIYYVILSHMTKYLVFSVSATKHFRKLWHANFRQLLVAFPQYAFIVL